MTTRLACADFTFPLVTHDQALDLVAMLGFSGVDIGLFQRRSHLWPSREFSSLTRSARALGKKTGDRGLKVADVFLQMGPAAEPYAINHPEPRRRRKVRDWFAKTLDYANECGAEHVTFHTRRAVLGRASCRVGQAFGRTAALVRRTSQITRHRLRCRASYRLDCGPSRPGSPARTTGAWTDLHARLHAFHTNGCARRRGRTPASSPWQKYDPPLQGLSPFLAPS